MNQFIRLTLMSGLAITILSCCDLRHDEGRPEYPVVVIGVDGGEWNVINSMIENGELPNFKRLIDKGVAADLVNPGPAISPPVWTTLATGHFPRAHGILDHVYPYDDSTSKIPVDSTMRRKPAIWNLATEHDLKSTVVGYFVSWPAETINGSIVSDKAWQNLPDSISPVEVETQFQDLLTTLRDQESWHELLDGYFPWGYRREQGLDENDPNYLAARQIVYRVDSLLAKDEAHRQIVGQLPIEDIDLFVAYYRAPDIASHSFWKYFQDASYNVKPSEKLKESLGNAIPESYRFVDQAIGELMDRFGDAANYIVVSDHGFRPVPEITIDSGRHQWELTGNHRLQGIFIAAGPDIEKGPVEMVTTMDIMPTIAYLLCLPISDELPGSVKFDLVRMEFDDRCPMNSVSAYTHVQVDTGAAPASLDASESTMNELRGLGYVGEDVEATYSQGSGDYDFWASSERVIVGHISGELVFYLVQGNTEVVAGIVAEIRANRPGLEAKIHEFTHAALRQLNETIPPNQTIQNLSKAFGQKRFKG